MTVRPWNLVREWSTEGSKLPDRQTDSCPSNDCNHELLPWELTHLFVFALSEDFDQFNQIQWVGLVVVYALVLVYLLVMPATGGNRVVHDFATTRGLKTRHRYRLARWLGEHNMLLVIAMIPPDIGYRMNRTPKAVMEKLFADVWNGQHPETATELVHEDYTIHDRDLADELAGPRLYRALAESTREIFPDARFTIEEIFVSGNKVAIRWRMTGTHEGELYGVEPTGTTVELPAIEINRFTDDKLVETWTQSDMTGLMEQIGATSSPEET